MSQFLDPSNIQSLVGFAVAYEGDMANPAGAGAIIAIEPTTYGIDAKISLEDGRALIVSALELFDKNSRVQIRTAVLHGAPYLAQLATAVVLRNARDAAAKTDQAARFAATVERIKAENPTLEAASGSKVASANLKRQLRAAFPGITFSVRNDGHAIRVKWEDGPTTEQVEQIANKYSHGSFDGMTDCYNYERSPWTEVFGGSRYVFCYRDHSDALVARAIGELAERYACGDVPTVEDFRNGSAYRVSPIKNGGHQDDWQTLIHWRCSSISLLK